MKGRTSKTRTRSSNPWLLIQHVVYTSRNGEEMNSWLSPLRLLSIVPAAWDDSVEWQSLFLVLHLSSPCPEPTLPWTNTTLKLQSSLWHQKIPHCFWTQWTFSRPQWPTVSGSTVCPVFRETSLNPAPLTLLWLLCKVHVLWMKCVIFEPVSVVKNGIEEAMIASGSTVKWSEIKITQ